jgi:hypothetical protein
VIDATYLVVCLVDDEEPGIMADHSTPVAAGSLVIKVDQKTF